MEFRISIAQLQKKMLLLGHPIEKFGLFFAKKGLGNVYTQVRLSTRSANFHKNTCLQEKSWRLGHFMIKLLNFDTLNMSGFEPDFN